MIVGFDLFCDENIEYVCCLMVDGVIMEFRVYFVVCYGF